MLNQLQNWIMKELVPLWVLMMPALSSYTLLACTNYDDLIDSRFTFVHKGILVIMHDCIGVSEQGH